MYKNQLILIDWRNYDNIYLLLSEILKVQSYK